MEFDSNNSPFISFQSTHPNFIITPPRFSDGETSIAAMNHPAVYMNLNGPPFPYTQQNWEEWFQIIDKESNAALAEWKETQSANGKEGERKWMSAAPVSTIREVDVQTGEERFVGNISIRRRGFLTVKDLEERYVNLSSSFF